MQEQEIITAHNDWSNQETWLTSLWLNNDESNYRILLEAKKTL